MISTFILITAVMSVILWFIVEFGGVTNHLLNLTGFAIDAFITFLCVITSGGVNIISIGYYGFCFVIAIIIGYIVPLKNYNEDLEIDRKRRAQRQADLQRQMEQQRIHDEQEREEQEAEEQWEEQQRADEEAEARRQQQMDAHNEYIREQHQTQEDEKSIEDYISELTTKAASVESEAASYKNVINSDLGAMPEVCEKVFVTAQEYMNLIEPIDESYKLRDLLKNLKKKYDEIEYNKYGIGDTEVAKDMKKRLHKVSHSHKVMLNGKLGEDRVFNTINVYNSRNKIIRDVNIPFNYGKSESTNSRDNSQIDIVVVNYYGIFAIEIKNYHPRNHQFTLGKNGTVYYGKYSKPNETSQLTHHTYALDNYLQRHLPSLTVDSSTRFVDSNPKNKDKSYNRVFDVYSLTTIVPSLRNRDNKRCLTKQQVNDIYNLLKQPKLHVEERFTQWVLKPNIEQQIQSLDYYIQKVHEKTQYQDYEHKSKTLQQCVDDIVSAPSLSEQIAVKSEQESKGVL